MWWDSKMLARRTVGTGIPIKRGRGLLTLTNLTL